MVPASSQLNLWINKSEQKQKELPRNEHIFYVVSPPPPSPFISSMASHKALTQTSKKLVQKTIKKGYIIDIEL